MNKQYEMVRDFQRKFGQPDADKPTVLSEDRRNERYEYMQEELTEFLFAKTVVDQADAMIDLIYLAIGTLVELGVKPEKLFEIVHNANMSKLWPDGKVHTNPENGKIIKPPTFVRPEPLLEAEINEQAVFTEVDALGDSDRGAGGFGSSGVTAEAYAKASGRNGGALERLAKEDE